MEQVVVVTGAAGLIGADLVRAFLLSQASTVHAVDVDRDGLDRLGGELKTGRLVTHDADVTDAGSMSELCDLACVDVLVHCAAIDVKRPVAEHDEALWRDTFMTNVAAPALATVRMRDALTARPGGNVVFLSSINGRWPSPWPEYGASKAALDKVTDDLARYFAPHGVRVNAVAPGYTAGRDSEAMRRGHRQFPLGGTPVPVDAVVHAVLFLADSTRSPMTTGQHLVVDGGATHGGGR